MKMSKKRNFTKPKDATTFRETKIGIIPRSKLVKLEAEGIRRGLKFIETLSKKDFSISSELILALHKKCFGWIFPIVWIHPFNDYNGRIARLLTNFIFLKLELPLLEIKIETKRDRENYIKAMQLADNHNYSLLEEIISSALQEALKKSLSNV